MKLELYLFTKVFFDSDSMMDFKKRVRRHYKAKGVKVFFDCNYFVNRWYVDVYQVA